MIHLTNLNWPEWIWDQDRVIYCFLIWQRQIYQWNGSFSTTKTDTHSTMNNKGKKECLFKKLCSIYKKGTTWVFKFGNKTFQIKEGILSFIFSFSNLIIMYLISSFAWSYRKMDKVCLCIFLLCVFLRQKPASFHASR